MAGQSDTKDRWNAKAYSDAAAFVPALATKVVQYLDAQPHERILDLGCGDGVLTATFAGACGDVLGLDSSPSMIATAAASVSSKHPNATFAVADCANLPIAGTHNAQSQNAGDVVLEPASFDKVFSNAAMHWILRRPETRQSFFDDVFTLLKPGGQFVFEMGGSLNISAIHTAIYSVLHFQHKIPMEKLLAADPWFFPSQKWMTETLRRTGFEVKLVEEEYRPSRATERKEDGTGGLVGWVRLMAQVFLELIPDQKERDVAVEEIALVLDHILTRTEDGSQWLGYVRCRGIAVKNAQGL